ncbi:DUF4199 domain-containing protein [Flavicella sediminum]|uniref:DUF4199 domain-containing protein n=1 Tax=Flavicella sediminum TaxID=2585141 RepID=UPI00112341E4|nr:DUF4199 domain-containing protein [Flavicella sediminum]
MDAAKANSKNIILNYGAILGATSILISLTQYVLGQHLSPNMIYGLLSIVIMILITFLAIRNFKATNDGFLSFGEAVKIGVGVAVISAVIAIIYNQLFMTFIEPDFMDQLIAKQEEDLFNKGLNEEQIEATMNMTNKMKGPFISSAIGIVASAFIGFIISAITGAIMKQSKEA